MKRLWTFIVCVAILFLSTALTLPTAATVTESVADSQDVVIGVLAKRSPVKCLQRWQPITEYLNENLYDKSFKILPLTFDEVEDAVVTKKVDFVLVNPAVYILLEVKYKASRILTLVQKQNSVFSTEFGGVIFYRADKGNFTKIEDLKGKSVVAFNQTALGGWLSIQFELFKKGMTPENDLAGLEFVDNMDDVVYEVLTGQSTFGCVRTGHLEKMSREGLIDFKELRVIHDHGGGKNHLPFVHSTLAYPEWPLAKLSYTNRYLADRVALVLLSLQAVDEAAVKAGIGGFTTALSYTPVRKLMKVLKQPPYEHQGEVTLGKVFWQYYHYIIFMFIMVLAVFIGIISLSISNNRVQNLQKEQKSTIEKLHLAEADAQARNYMAQELLNAIPLPVFYLDGQSNFRGCNYAFEELSRFSKNELRGKSGVDFKVAGGISIITEADKDLLQNLGLISREFAVDRDGERTQHELKLSVYRNTEQQPAGLIGVISDLTSHKLLARRMAQLSAVIEQAAESIVITDLEGNIQYVNPAFEKITGYSMAEALGQNPRVLKSGRQDDNYYKELWETLAKGEIWRGAFVNKRKDGTFFDESAAIFPIRNDDDEIIALAAVKRDITHEKAMQTQLRTSQRLEAVGQLAAGVAHELNTPIGFVASNFESITGYVKNFVDLIELYRKTVSDLAGQLPEAGPAALEQAAELEEDLQIEFILEDLDDLFSESRDGFARISSIVTKLREFSRIDQMDAKESFNFNRAIETTMVVARNEYKYSAEIELNLESELPDVMASGGEINQVVLNLIINAAQAIKEQERSELGKIEITTEYDDDWVRCRFADDGPGIKPENIERIFDPFFTTKPVGKGTGLGLNISYDIITKKHNGSLVVESTLGEGTTFFIALPRHNATSEKG